MIEQDELQRYAPRDKRERDAMVVAFMMGWLRHRQRPFGPDVQDVYDAEVIGDKAIPAIVAQPE